MFFLVLSGAHRFDDFSVHDLHAQWLDPRGGRHPLQRADRGVRGGRGAGKEGAGQAGHGWKTSSALTQEKINWKIPSTLHFRGLLAFTTIFPIKMFFHIVPIVQDVANKKA
jgi:hypothetical protein